ncbi:MAG: DNA-processing protein DprA [Saprospiraceae bacterium]|nr:DNA-processing protein DprA [Saprospiraceae bacterium]
MYDQQLLYKIAITHIPLVGSVLAKNVISFSGGVEAVFQQRKSSLIKIPGIGDKIADSIVKKKSFQKAEEELAFIEKHGIKAVFYLDDEYPFRLKRIKDAPVILYHKGVCDLNHPRIIGVVGTRRPSNYGRTQCEKLIEDVSGSNPLIISGLAYGIDITAHRTALKQGLATLGVMGTGLDRIYPAAHRRTASEMVDHGGLVTEFGKATEPDRENFPMRNRIIAGMCDALVVVESDRRGGSMITAEMANGYHKDVFALPGRIGDSTSKGCNFLIKTNRAHLLEGGNELAEMMQWESNPEHIVKQQSLFEDLSTSEQQIFDLLSKEVPTSIDRIYKESSLSASEIASGLLNLEFKGMLRSLPGKMYLLQ